MTTRNLSSLFTNFLGTLTSIAPGLQTTNAAGQAVYLDPNGTTYTYHTAGTSMVDLSLVVATTLNSTSLTSQIASFGTMTTNQLQLSGPVLGYGTGSLLMRAFDATNAANSGTWINNPVSGRPYFSQLVSSINYTNSSSGVAIGGDNSNYFVRFTGYIAVNTTDTYTFQIAVDDGARLFLNNSKVIESWKSQGVTSYTSPGIALATGSWIPIIAEWWQGSGGSCFQLQYKNTTNATIFTPLTHGTASGQIQLAYDNSESAPSQLGTTFVNGDLLIGGALNIPSTSVPVNPLQSSVTLYNDSSDNMTKIVQPGGTLQSLTYGSEFSVYMNTTSQTSSNTGNTVKMINQQSDSLLGGTYRLDISYTVKCGSTSGYANITFAVDGVIVHTNVPYSTSGQPIVTSDFSIVTLGTGVHALVLSFRSMSNLIPMTMSQATVALCRVA